MKQFNPLKLLISTILSGDTAQAASNAGSLAWSSAMSALVVSNGTAWSAIPADLKQQKYETFTATGLVSGGGGWTKDPRAKWITVIVVGGGASGSCSNNYNQTSYGGGGEPGAVEVYSGPATDFPATVDVIVGAGGATPTTAVTSNDGGTTQFGNLLRALGGRGYISRRALDLSAGGVNGWMNILLPLCSFRLGIPGNNVGGNSSAVSNKPSDSTFGPGAGASASGSAFGLAGGAASLNRPQSSVAGGSAISNPSGTVAGNNGGNAVANDPWSFGGGGGSGGNTGGTGGNGGIPGGGGAGSNNSTTNTTTYFVAPGAGGRGEVRVLSYW